MLVEMQSCLDVVSRRDLMIYMYSRRDLLRNAYNARRDLIIPAHLVEILARTYKNCKPCVGFYTWRGAVT